MTNGKPKKTKASTSISKKATRTESTRQRKLTIGWRIVGCVIVLLIGLFIYDQRKPHPLGQGEAVTYLGKTEAGIYIPVLSWSHNSDVYYYGTDMSVEELANHLGAKITDKTGNPHTFSSYNLQLKTNKSVTIYFYNDKTSDYSAPPKWASETSKKHFFSMLESHYEIFKQSL